MTADTAAPESVPGRPSDRITEARDRYARAAVEHATAIATREGEAVAREALRAAEASLRALVTVGGLCVGDRVWTTGGTWAEWYGRIVDIEPDGSILVEPDKPLGVSGGEVVTRVIFPPEARSLLAHESLAAF